MRRFRIVVPALLVMSVLLGAGLAARSEAAAPGDVIPGRFIVIMQPGAPVAAVLRDHGLVADRIFEHAGRGFGAALTPDQRDRLLRDARINNVVPDRVVRVAGAARAPILPAVAGLPTGVDRIDAEGAAPGSSVAVAIIDTGIDLGRPELNIAGAVSFVSGNTTGQDDNGHGTLVAGTAAGRVMGSGFRGVAPGAPVYAVKVMDSTGTGTLSSVVAGIDWVTAHAASDGIRVANLSLGTAGTDSANCGVTGMTVVDPLHKAICDSVAAGVVYTVAAGNGGADASGTIPAAYPEVVAVSGMGDSDGRGGHFGAATWAGADDTFAPFSNFGPVVQLAAPGVDILSIAPTGACALCDPSGYLLASGTSIAAPHAAGALVDYLALHPGASTTGSPGALAPAALAVIAMAQPQASPCGFSGDPGGEPLVYVGQPATQCGFAASVGGTAEQADVRALPAPRSGSTDGRRVDYGVLGAVALLALGAVAGWRTWRRRCA